MSNQIYANGMEISCKAAQGKSICAFPDVCFTPPQTPATPPGVPIPYPNTGLACDTSDGSSTVKISGQEVMLKDKSCFKKSAGDEAGCAPKKGVITSKNTGKVYFTKWSMDVKVEGENVVRMMDLTTHNHGSMVGNSPTWPYIDEAAFAEDSSHPCAKTAKKLKDNCGEHKPKSPRGRKAAIAAMCAKPACKEALQCALSPYSPDNCCDNKTPHHLVEVHCFTEIGGRDEGKVMSEFSGYNDKKAPCICASGQRYEDGEHGACHAIQQGVEAAYSQRLHAPHTAMSSGESNWTYAEARDAGVYAQSLVFPDCDPDCTTAQLDEYHKASPPDGPGLSDDTPIRSDMGAEGRSRGNLSSSQQAKLDTHTLFILASGF